MKSCGYCGRENQDHAIECTGCGVKMPEAKSGSAFPSLMPTRGLIDVDAIEGAFELRDGFSRPNWKVIHKAVQSAVYPDELEAAWTDVAIQWLDRLRKELGGSYHVEKSKHYLMLSPLDPEVTARMLNFSERARSSIDEILGGLRREKGKEYGPHAIMLFDEDDDYYQYVSGFHSDGVHPRTGGMHIGGGYRHTVIAYHSEFAAVATLAHELSHDAVHHLRIPLWLNEGLAQVLEKSVGNYHRASPLLTRDLAEEHRQFWDEKRIQGFWAGTSFRVPGDSMKLSYSLAEIMMNLLMKDRDGFMAFVRVATPEDGGQTAALDVLGVCLGETLVGFLGEGNWRPQRKAIRECWEAEKKGVKAEGGEGKPYIH